ncbi:regulator of G-protein signaling loco isoform X2 [Chelonus insularis]|uniref:regulator of G-protein signaling loco isoform X2 n=1 Tax=Chelonus insularis TaxID=460826 RepID=UPI00158C0CDC|nr:regulator of G-protein signaling loco isoform X2 [Chelonus insularis]
MHHNRRKKKRINYGVRVVEIVKGSKGYGFTISGQQPCILSCIVPGSPAETAGLRAGDYLVAVNGYNVGKAPHDDVVRLIGNSKGILRLQIAENYYSDSSDEEGLATARSKPKYSHKTTRSSNVNDSVSQLQYTVDKVVQDLQTGAMFKSSYDNQRILPQSKMQCSQNGMCHRWNITNSLALPPPPPPPHSNKRDTEKIVHRTVVGYLGTIDIPNQLHPSIMMQVLKKCIKRLKAEKRNPTTVLLTIHVANIKLTNSENNIIAEYPSHRIIFCNSFSEQDQQYFGILTKSAKDAYNIVSNSCHVFTIYYKLIDHAVHLSTSNIFGFICTKTSELNVCQEFPDSCNSLIGAIQTLYISNSNENGNDPSGCGFLETRRNLDTVSPQPSNISTSTAHSSNSDSGIGFKDEYGSQSDRNINIDSPLKRYFHPNHHLGASEPSLLGQNISNESAKMRIETRMSLDPWTDDSRVEFLTESFEKTKNNENTLTEGETISCHNEGQNETQCSGDSNTCPKTSAVTKLIEPVGTWFFSQTHTKRSDMSELMDSIKQNDYDKSDIEMCNKLSPKVFNVSKSLVHSLENLKQDDEQFSALLNSFAGKSNEQRLWTSLQEIRNVDQFKTETGLYDSTDSCDKLDSNSGIHTWASGFEKLLKDPKGLETFAEFLKKEFSHENIYFWAACERYKNTEDVSDRRALAWKIYQRHLSATAVEPVNVDSHATGQITQELLNHAPVDLFLQAQKQIFNLMKFDSYPRFLRSDLYRHCLETGSSNVVSTEDCDLALTNSPSVKLKKSHSDAEDRCRKSILPWNRKNRSKSKDRGESEYNKTPSRNEIIYKSFTTMKRDNEGNSNDDNISISSSRSSLASWDLALRQSFSKHLVNLKYSSSVLAGQEVEVVPAKVLKVDLPSRRILTVVAHKGRKLKDVLRPLLNKYGFKLELITIWGDGHPVSLDIPAINAPSRLVLTSNHEDFQKDVFKCPDSVPQGQSTLDEITNKVFEELLVGKSNNKYQSEGSCKSDDQRSEGSSILSNKFFLRDSTVLGKKRSKNKGSNMSDKSTSDCTGEESSHSSRPHAPLIAKWRNGVKLQLPGKLDSDELLEGIKRAQRSRLEDQRGTEINFELPDFLKNKENNKHTEEKKIRRARLTVSANCDSTSKFYDASMSLNDDKKKQNYTTHTAKFEESKCNNNIEELDKNINAADVNKNSECSGSLDVTLEDGDKTIIENGNISPSKSLESSPSHSSSSTSLSPTKLLKPPPLPPKPKGLLSNALKPSQVLSTKPILRSTQLTTESRTNNNIF